MTSNISTSEVLNRAADLLEKRGWIGEGGLGWDFDLGGPLCLEGAVQAAAGLRSGINTRVVNNCPAGRAVREFLGLIPEWDWHEWSGGNIPLFAWNDEARRDDNGGLVNVRTATEVIAVLRATAVIEAAKENTSTDVRVEAEAAR